MAPLGGTVMLTRALATGTVLTITMVTVTMMTRAVLTVTMAARAMLAGAMVASAVLTARVHADVHAVVLALVYMDVDGVLARVHADIHGIFTGINADVRTRPGIAGGTRAPARAMSAFNVNVHFPGVVGNLDVDELVNPVAFGYGFLR